MQVFILASAEQDLKELRAYILGRFSPERWNATYGHIKEACVFRSKLNTDSGGN